MGVAISLRNLHKTYLLERGREVRVLKGLDLEIGAGECVCILGPSGCGKTTLLNLLSGMEAPTSGTVSATVSGVAGDRVIPLREMAIGRVFQEPRLLPWLTVERNLMLVLQGLAWSRGKKEQKISESLGTVKLLDYRDYYPHQLSGGMQQRVAVARAIAVEPVVLLLDEPFSALDEPLALQLSEDLFTFWHTAPRTTLFVTHNVLDAMKLGDRLLYLDSETGQIARIWKMDLPHPRNPNDPGFQRLYLEVREEIHQRYATHPDAPAG